MMDMKSTSPDLFQYAQEQFHHWASKLWDNYEKVIKRTVTFYLEDYSQFAKKRVKPLACVVGVNSPKAIQNTIYYRAPYYKVFISPRLIELGEEKISRVMAHEAIHLGIHQHNDDFKRLAKSIGASVTEYELEGGKPRLLVKVGARYKDTGLSFDSGDEAYTAGKKLISYDDSPYYQQRMQVKEAVEEMISSVIRGTEPREVLCESSIDDKYLLAVEKKDFKTLNKMVDAAARKAGFNLGPLFHGTRAEDVKFEVFKTATGDDFGIHFGEAESANSIVYQDGGSKKEESIRAFYLKCESPLEMYDVGIFYPSRVARELLNQEFISDETYRLVEETENKNMKKAHALVASLLLKYHLDGITYINEVEGGGRSYAVVSPNQIKSADPIVYTKSGEVVPLSERFNSSSNSVYEVTA